MAPTQADAATPRAIPRQLLHHIRGYAEAVFALDPRSLAAFRVLLAAVAFCSALAHMPDAVALYSDAGILPRELTRAGLNLAGSFPLGMVSGSSSFFLVLFALQALAAIGMAFGLRTRLCTAICWAVALATRERNVLAADAGQDVLVLALFWALFLPTHARASLDRLRAPEPARTPAVSTGSAGLVIQLFCIYFFAALLKTGRSWRVEGTALYQTLALDWLATPFGKLLRDHHGLCRTLTFATFDLEFYGSLALLLIPNALVRGVIAVSFIALHLGILLTMDIPLFALAAIAVWLALLPGSWWERVPRPEGINGMRARLWPVAPGPVKISSLPGWASALASGAIALVLACNLEALPGSTPQAGWLRWLDQATGLAQGWTMFAPDPEDTDGWFVVPARLADGSRIDLMREAPVDFARPAQLRKAFPDRFWRNQMMNTVQPADRVFVASLAHYLCRRWSAGHPANPARTVDVVFMLERTRPDDPAPPANETTLFTGTCESAPRDAPSSH